MDAGQRPDKQDTGPDAIEVRILEATIALAVEGGYEAVRQRDVAARAGVALATVYAGFEGKDAMLAAALVEDSALLLDRVREMPLSGKTPLQRVAQLFEHLTAQTLARPMLARAALRAANAGQRGTTLSLMEAQQGLMRLLVRVLRGPREQPQLDSQDAGKVATVLVMAWYANLTGWAGGLANAEIVVAIMEQTADMLLHGVPSAKQPPA